MIFSSLAAGSAEPAGKDGAEYKLTLSDNRLSIAVTSAEKENRLIKLGYTITDNSDFSDPARVSVVVTNGTWTKQGWSEGACLLQYGKLETETSGNTGNGTFTLSEEIKGEAGKDYHIYILAEDVRGDKETDYASEPVEVVIHIPKIMPDGVSLSANEIKLKIGETATLKATVDPENATEKTLNRKSDNEAVATVDDKGMITAVWPGSTKITVSTVNGKTAECTVTVEKKYFDDTDEAIRMFEADFDTYVKPEVKIETVKAEK